VTIFHLYLRAHNLINQQQHEFLSGSLLTCINLEAINDRTLAVKDRSVVAAYVDYSKAFDYVSRSKLLIKLSFYGVDGNLLCWVKSVLANRS
jgi:hypothetical protein